MIQLAIESEEDIIVAASFGKSLAREMGFSIVDQTKITVSISELTRNVINYGIRGYIQFRKSGRCLEITVQDEGPGILNIKEAMRDGMSTGNGLGLGLSGTQRLMDEFHIESEVGTGTCIIIRKWLPDQDEDKGL
ncbi:ATP-binding protein [Aneurinibacillus aneurinilyticus]|jgi:serine/threonine-protein kinase RsbT|uniref:Anti-sigma regulatory factor n=1 Tax=Aneurinibacillus aneurinilyticus TaxID=1391 RepID=A0A848CTV9_ANEAE|nr:ATP-binding protein [Aneurinibacillus aneurinilyticus]NME96650.1 anti-sigma regulatory factor [Aneurinibacillus aneurinilyticus]